jgi:predicted DNA-binding transcriptional regulator AlpA
MNNTSAVEGPVLLKKDDVAKVLQVSTRQVENLVRAGRIPKPVYLSPQSPRWRREELMAAVLGDAAGGPVTRNRVVQ